MAKASRFAVSLHVLTTLLYRKGEWMTSLEIAKGVNTHPVVIRRILSLFSEAGIIESAKGKKGGVRMSDQGLEKRLSEIYKLVESEPLLGIHQNEEYKPCPVSCKMKSVLEKVFEEAEDAFLKKLSQVKLKRLVEEVKSS